MTKLAGNPMAEAICAAVLDANKKRSDHFAPALEVDINLCRDAQNYAQKLASRLEKI